MAPIDSSIDSSNLSFEEQNSGKNKARKRKHDGIEFTEEHELPNGDSCSQILSALRNICTCFGVDGLCNTKKSYEEADCNIISILFSKWSPAEIIQNLSTEMKNRYIKEISEKSFRLLVLIKKVSSLFKRLHEGRKSMKDVTMDIYLKDVKTKPSLSPPDQYIEIGLWRQVMKINQQLCQKMEQLDQDEGCKENPNTSVGHKQAQDHTQETTNLEKDMTSTFHDYYMEVVTSSFGDDLDHIRQEGNLDARKVEMLINCLETGKDIWSDLEKRLLQTKGS
ncbi:unnamed protein product [Porites evermanni]|uniref:Ribosome assembly protein 3 n=1 Tax=Porites evermanni TaxID=104178 RepID=A0ABN8LGW2_9CNID|nr:unnamed protein product [Porites evermanni]